MQTSGDDAGVLRLYERTKEKIVTQDVRMCSAHAGRFAAKHGLHIARNSPYTPECVTSGRRIGAKVDGDITKTETHIESAKIGP
jgi:hypothetical protein